MSIKCERCGCTLHDEDDIFVFDGVEMCEDCFENNTCVCDRCGRRIWNDEDAGDEDITLCSSCRDDYYTTCEDCGRIIHNDDAYYDDDEDYPYCSACYHDDYVKKYIRNYSYKPDPNFYGDDDLYMGVELEIDNGGCYDDNAKILLDIANEYHDHMYIKTDGSICSGMEMVTHPMTLDYHMEKMPWSEITAKAISLGYRSHKTTTCGLHVHVNRDAFGNNLDEQEPCISRILFLVERFWQELLSFSRRTEAQIDRWAARYGIKENPKQVMDNAKSMGRGRYACVNLTNYSTIEFRIFRGTLKYNTLIATLQMVNRICRAAIEMTDAEITSLSWPEFVEKITEPELIQYLKEHRLYINEPITGMEEF